MRRRERGTPPPVTPQPQKHIVTQERTYSLITPLFGGGAIPGERDEVTVVRGTEIRGHLRFWWRACYGGRYSNVEEMKQAEDRIWGAASTSKKDEKERTDAEQKPKDDGEKFDKTVQVVVEVLNKGREVELFPIMTAEEYAKRRKGNKDNAKGKRQWESPYERRSGIPQYVAFMFQLSSEEKEKKEPTPRRLVYADVAFKLTISFPEENRADIEGALWVWENFGGIGARTRRGFGALRLVKIYGEDNTDLPTSSDVVQWIRDHITNLQAKSQPQVQGKAPEKVPCLIPEMEIRTIGPFSDAAQAWEKGIAKLSEFRQFPNGRDTQFGPSKWPEAEAIYTLTGKKRSSPSSTIPRKFPRAAFGLPIIFNFLKRPDLQKLSLQGAEENHDRLSSPLILRPLVYKNNSGKDVAVSLAVVLENFSFPPKGIVLVEQNGKRHRADPIIEEGEVGRIAPLTERNILSAFMQYFGGNH